jgi:molecular chaperone GrpE
MSDETNATQKDQMTEEQEKDGGEIEQAEAVEESPPLSLEEHLAEAQAQAEEYLDGWQRSRAELANYRRRIEAHRAEMVATANADLLTRLLPVLDDLQLALDNSPQEQPGGQEWDEWREGVALVAHKFAAVLEVVGVALIETEGQVFDPHLHEAVSSEAHPDAESGQIIGHVRPGYKLGDRVLRASMVRVAQ